MASAEQIIHLVIMSTLDLLSRSVGINSKKYAAKRKAKEHLKVSVKKTINILINLQVCEKNKLKEKIRRMSWTQKVKRSCKKATNFHTKPNRNDGVLLCGCSYYAE